MPRITRVGVTFPPGLLVDFDEIIAKMGYRNRSKAIQDAVRLFISERRRLQEEGESQAGVLVMLYNHEIKGLETTLTRLQHQYSSIICSTIHIHLSETECIEAIAVKGKAAEIRKLGDELTSRRGVELLKTMVFSV